MDDLQKVLRAACVDDHQDKAAECAYRDFLMERGEAVDEFSLFTDQFRALMFRSMGVPKHLLEHDGG